MPLSELMDFDAFLCLKGMPLATSSRAPATLAHWHIGIFLLGADEVFVQATEQEFRSHCRGWGILGKNRYQYQEHIILNHDSHVWDALLFILCNNVPWTWLLDFGAMAGTRWLRKCENVDDAGTRTNSHPTSIYHHPFPQKSKAKWAMKKNPGCLGYILHRIILPNYLGITNLYKDPY